MMKLCHCGLRESAECCTIRQSPTLQARWFPHPLHVRCMGLLPQIHACRAKTLERKLELCPDRTGLPTIQCTHRQALHQLNMYIHTSLE